MPTLDPERWRRVSRLYDEVVELDGAERAAYLEQACSGDPRLRAEVEELLASDERMGAFLERPAGEDGGTLMSRLADGETPLEVERAPGSRIGPWRVLREVGRGGMGVVYLVERADTASTRDAPRSRSSSAAWTPTRS